MLVSAPEPLRARYRGLTTRRLLPMLRRARGCQGDDIVTTSTRTVLHALAERATALEDEIADHDQALRTLVTMANPALLQATGIGLVTAAQLLLTFGDNPGRIRTEAAFAALCGAAPVPASSGKTNRHRLNRGGDRRANNALHDIAVVRLHVDPATRRYAQRRTTEGKTKKDIPRCLKRAIAREAYHLCVDPPQAIDPAELRDLRQAAGIPLQQAAIALGCSIQKLSYLERGIIQNRQTMIIYRDYLTTQETSRTPLNRYRSIPALG